MGKGLVCINLRVVLWIKVWGFLAAELLQFLVREFLFSGVTSHRIMECPDLEGSHKGSLTPIFAV